MKFKLSLHNFKIKQKIRAKTKLKWVAVNQVHTDQNQNQGYLKITTSHPLVEDQSDSHDAPRTASMPASRITMNSWTFQNSNPT